MSPRIKIPLLALALVCGLSCGQAVPGPQKTGAAFAWDPAVRYQTFQGWGGAIASWHNVYSRTPIPHRPEVLAEGLDAVTEDLRLNHFNVGLRMMAVEPKNDNADPQHTEGAGFDFYNQDRHIDQVILPIRDRLQKRGERMVLYLVAVFHVGKTPQFLANFDEYVEFALASLAHFRERGLEADYWVMNNEPDLNRAWGPSEMGLLAARLGEAFERAGYRTKIAGPETVIPDDFAKWFLPVVQTPGVLRHLGAITYHNYDHDPSRGEEAPMAPRANLAQWGRTLGLPVIQTEQGEGGVGNRERWAGYDFGAGLDLARTIISDLTYANVSAWQMHAVTSLGVLGPKSSAGGVFFFLAPDGSAVTRPAHYYALRLFTRTIRPGSVRVELRTTQQDQRVRGVAFLSAKGQPLLVVLNENTVPTRVEVTALPAGKYQREEASRVQFHPSTLRESRIGAGETLAWMAGAESITAIWLDGPAL